MKNNDQSLKRIFSGFQNLSPKDKAAYLKYFKILVERNPNDKNLLKFKTKLENEIRIQKIKSVSSARV